MLLGAGWVVLPRRCRSLLLISPLGILPIFPFSTCATYVGKLVSSKALRG